MSNTDHLFFGTDFDPNSTKPINFLETPFMYLSPFSAHEIVFEGLVFKTVEHAHHALRINPGPERDEIVRQGSPMDAWRVSQKYKNNPNLMTEGFNKLQVMEKLLRAKLEQYSDVKNVLLATGSRELLKVYDTDYYWGTGADGSGENQMGKLWMKLRAELDNK